METDINVQIITERPINVTITGEIGAKGDPLSVPPQGYFQVKNLYVNTEGKLIVLYDDNSVI